MIIPKTYKNMFQRACDSYVRGQSSWIGRHLGLGGTMGGTGRS